MRRLQTRAARVRSWFKQGQPGGFSSQFPSLSLFFVFVETGRGRERKRGEERGNISLWFSTPPLHHPSTSLSLHGSSVITSYFSIPPISPPFFVFRHWLSSIDRSPCRRTPRLCRACLQHDMCNGIHIHTRVHRRNWCNNDRFEFIVCPSHPLLFSFFFFTPLGLPGNGDAQRSILVCTRFCHVFSHVSRLLFWRESNWSRVTIICCHCCRGIVELMERWKNRETVGRGIIDFVSWWILNILRTISFATN